MCVPAPTSWPPASTTTAPTAGLGDTNPTPARANSSVRRMCCSSIVIQEPFHHRDTETQRHREKPIYKLRGGKLRCSSSSSGSANATAPDRFCGPRLLGDGTPAKGSSTKGSSSDSEGSRELNRFPTKRRTNQRTTIPIASCHQTLIRCFPQSSVSPWWVFRRTATPQTLSDQTAADPPPSLRRPRTAPAVPTPA